jgi:hypothetical protein
VNQDPLSAGNSALNISAATVVKVGSGKVMKVSMNTAGAGAQINDCATTGAAAASNLIAVLPNAVGVTTLDWPFTTGLCVNPGAGVVSVSWSNV